MKNDTSRIWRVDEKKPDFPCWLWHKRDMAWLYQLTPPTWLNECAFWCHMPEGSTPTFVPSIQVHKIAIRRARPNARRRAKLRKRRRYFRYYSDECPSAGNYWDR